ncbi:MAG: AAA family ATPase, partial [Thermoplasmata archaeon]|nr:AAA family ATPase [Thermoplasmata archaeon]
MAEEGEVARSFIGRGEAVEALHLRFEEVRGGAGGVTLLVGDAGIGKSALISEFVQEVRTRGVRVLVGRAPALDDPPPFSLLQSAIESAREDPLLQSDEDPTLGGGPMLIGFAPGLGEDAFPTPLGIEGRLLQLLGGTGARGTTSRDQVLSGITDRLLEFTRHGPTVLVLEDIQRADTSSLAAVEFFANELQTRPFWILATLRPGASLSTLGRARTEAFETATRAGRVLLRPMTSDETAMYLRQGDPSREMTSAEVTRRFTETGGNPFLLQQLDHRTDPGARIPEGGSETAPPLDADSARTLDSAAVLGPQFDFALLLRATEDGEEHLAEVVEGLVGRGLLFERPGELLEFPEDRRREEVYNLLSEKRRRILHRRSGEALEGMAGADRTQIYALAHHFYLGRAGPKSVHYNRAAARIAELALAPDVAWDHLARALESQREQDADDWDSEADLVLELARLTEELGALQDAEGLLREFFDRAKDGRPLSPLRRATLEIFLARVLTDRGELPAAAELAKKVLETPGLDDQPLVGVGAHHQLGQVLYYQGHYPEALEHHTAEIGLAQRVGNPMILARAQIWRVAALSMLGETAQAIAEAREVTAARDRLGSVRESAQAHLFLGDILADARSPPSDRQDAIGEFAAAVRFAETAKDPRRVGWALYKTTELLREAGRLDEAAAMVERACHILGQIGDQVGLSVSIKVRGQVAM